LLLHGLFRGGSDDSLDASVKAALVTAGGVLVQNTLLDALIEQGDGRAVLLAESLLVASGDGLAQGTEGAAKLGLVGAVDGGLGDGLARTLEGRNCICHEARFSFLFNPGFSWENGDARGG
jgi:hypothetical protein